MLIDFCLPVKDEELILETNALKIYHYLESLNLDYQWQIVILVNGSTDKSFQIAKDLAEKYHPHFKVKQIVQGGKSLALKEYFKESDADILAFMDIDIAVALENIPALIKPLVNNEADLVIGSRLLPDSKIIRSALRDFSSSNYNRLSRILFHNKITDLQCGFKAFKKEVFSKVYPYLRDDRWFFDAEFIILAGYFGYAVTEIPVDWQDNRYFERQSKVRNSEAYYFVKKIINLKKYLRLIKTSSK